LDTLPRSKHAGHNSGRRNAREAILQDIKLWIEDLNPDTPPIFWLNGLAGIGKSTIAQTVAEDTMIEGCLTLASSFPTVMVPSPILSWYLPTPAFQLAQWDPTFKHRIGAVLQKKPDAG
jgi:hypothetical protein